MHCICVPDDVVKDITVKYSANWATSMKRLRLDEHWWSQVLEPFRPPVSCVRNLSEDQHIHGNECGVFERLFVIRFTLCYRTVVCLCL